MARMLPRGEITDGLSGLRALPDAELPALAQRIAEELAAVLPGLIERKFRELRQSAAGESAALRHVNTKFSLDGAFVGRFATLDDFHRGPEEHIGVPNPRIEEGVEAEHCRRSNSINVSLCGWRIRRIPNCVNYWILFRNPSPPTFPFGYGDGNGISGGFGFIN